MNAATYIMLHILCDFLHTVPAVQITRKQLDQPIVAQVSPCSCINFVHSIYSG